MHARGCPRRHHAQIAEVLLDCHLSARQRGMEDARLREKARTSVNVTVSRRSRESLTEQEVERLIEAAKQNRSGHRDAAAILVAYRHGLEGQRCL